MKNTINCNTAVTATVMTNAVVTRVHGAQKDWACMSYKVKESDGRIVKVNEFRKLENADAAVNKAKYFVAGRKVDIAVSQVVSEDVDNKLYVSYNGFGRLI